MNREFLISVLLIAATFAVFAPVLGSDFVNIDDGLYVTGNAFVKNGLTHVGIAEAFQPQIGHWHPLTWLSYMLDVQLFGVSSAAVHSTNLLLHLTNTVLLFLVLSRMTGCPWRSAVVAALFAFHPLHVEPVAWASSRKDVLSTLALLITLLAYRAYVKKPSWQRMAGVSVFYGLGLMAKPSLVALPAVLLLLDYWPLKRFGTWQEARKGAVRLLAEKIPLFVLTLGSVGMTIYAASSWGAVGSETITFPLSARIPTVFTAYAVYLRKTLWPFDLCAYYPHPGESLSLVWAAVSAGVLVVLSIAASFNARKRPYLLVGWLWFLGTLLPVIGIMQIGRHWIADRYTYVPLIGVFSAVTWALADALAEHKQGKAILRITVAAILTACMVASAVQVRHWRDSERLWRHALAVSPANHLAHGNLGSHLARQGRLDEAAEHFREAVAIEPTFVTAHYNLGLALLLQKQYASAAESLSTAVQLKPDHVSAWIRLAEAQHALGRNADASVSLEHALALSPDNLAALKLLQSLGCN